MAVTKLLPSIGVADIKRSLDFYRAIFGFEMVDSYEQDGRMIWCWVRAGKAEMMLQQLAGDEQIRLNPAIGQSWCIYVRVDDVDATHSRLRERGFPVSDLSETDYGTREFFVEDLDGYELWVSKVLEDDTDEQG
ncbi:MAG TPA: VOC family protein [Burkholderiales bacterium]|nr:VOC family protein [Burkholderiales bacterium]